MIGGYENNKIIANSSHWKKLERFTENEKL